MAHQPLTRDIVTQYGLDLDSRADGVVEIVSGDVEGLEGQGVVFCPNPKMPLWSAHPRVFIDIGTKGTGRCPYCGTVYRLKDGEKLPHGH